MRERLGISGGRFLGVFPLVWGVPFLVPRTSFLVRSCWGLLGGVELRGGRRSTLHQCCSGLWSAVEGVFRGLTLRTLIPLRRSAG